MGEVSNVSGPVCVLLYTSILNYQNITSDLPNSVGRDHLGNHDIHYDDHDDLMEI